MASLDRPEVYGEELLEPHAGAPRGPDQPETPRGGVARRRFPVFAFVTYVLVAVIALLILYPVLRTIIRAFYIDGGWDFSAYEKVLTAPWLPGVLLNTSFVVAAAGLLALVTASTFAWLNERTDARLGVLGDVMPLVPLLLPHIAMAIGWVFLASENIGFINSAIDSVFGPLGISFQVNVASWPGLIYVYALYFVPYVYLIVAAALRNVDSSLEEASRLSGASLWMTIRRVTFPSVKPALVGAMLLVVIVGFSLYSIPVVIATRARIDILSVRIIRMMTYDFPPKPDEAIVLATILLMGMVLVWLLYRRVTGTGHFAQLGGKATGRVTIELGPLRWPARIAMIGYLLSTSVLPMAALAVVALQPYWQATIRPSQFTLNSFRAVLIESPVTRDALRFSLSLGSGGGLIAMATAIVIALFIRRRGRLSESIDGITKLPAAFSNIVIAIGFLVAFSGPPFNLSGTLLILLLVYLVIYMPQASIAAGAAVAQIGSELTEASTMSGATEGRTFRRIIGPLVLPGAVAGWALVFVLMAGDLAASALLAGMNSPVIGFVILDIWEQGTFGALAALAFTVAAITTTVIAVAYSISRWLQRSWR